MDGSRRRAHACPVEPSLQRSKILLGIRNSASGTNPHTVMPAQAGSHEPLCWVRCPWVPAFAGMTSKQDDAGVIEPDVSSVAICRSAYRRCDFADEPDRRRQDDRGGGQAQKENRLVRNTCTGQAHASGARPRSASFTDSVGSRSGVSVSVCGRSTADWNAPSHGSRWMRVVILRASTTQ